MVKPLPRTEPCLPENARRLFHALPPHVGHFSRHPDGHPQIHGRPDKGQISGGRFLPDNCPLRLIGQALSHLAHAQSQLRQNLLRFFDFAPSHVRHLIRRVNGHPQLNGRADGDLGSGGGLLPYDAVCRLIGKTLDDLAQPQPFLLENILGLLAALPSKVRHGDHLFLGHAHVHLRADGNLRPGHWVLPQDRIRLDV